MRGNDERPETRPAWCAANISVAVMIVVACVAPGRAVSSPDTLATIEPGAIELGVDGSMTTVEGITRGAVRLRGGYFWPLMRGLAGAELAAGYRHVSSLDEGDIEAAVSWQRRFRRTTSYPFVSFGGGIRYEDIGSFGHTWYPLGFSVGVRSLLGQRAGFRFEYRFRRILNDPSSDFSEQSVTVGLSVFFANKRDNGKE